jgi:hypothetical protein
MKTTYNQFAVLRCNGEWDHFKAPSFFGMDDVAAHCSHSTVTMFVPKGRRISIAHQFVDGPIWAVWDKERKDFAAYWHDLNLVPLQEAYQFS